MVTFWKWFISGSGARPGYRRVINKWLFLHLAIGTTLAYIIKESLSEAAKTVLFPLSSIFVGLAFAWSANIHGLLNTKEISLVIKQKDGGIYEYIYIVQISILLIMTTLIFWGLAGLRIYDNPAIIFPYGALTSKALCNYAEIYPQALNHPLAFSGVIRSSAAAIAA